MVSPANVSEPGSPEVLEQPTAARRDTAEQRFNTIREILVGEDIDGLNSNFFKLRKDVESYCAKLNSELSLKFDEFENRNEAEADDLRIIVTEAVNELRKEGATMTEEVQSGMERIAQVEKRVDELKGSFSEQIRKMHQEFYKQMSEFSRLVKSRQEEVARQAVSRDDFAKVLSGLAGSLSPVPSEETPADPVEVEEQASE